MCRTCGKKIFDYPSNHRKFCSVKCYYTNLKTGVRLGGLSRNEIARRYRIRHPNQYKVECAACGGLKHRTSQFCRSCANKEKSGVKSKFYKGGYECKLKNNRERILKLKVSGFHTVEQWEGLKKLAGYKCLACGLPEPVIKLTRDHIIPISKGGSDLISNLQPLCLSCNVKKHTKIICFNELPETIKVAEY